MPSRSRKKMKGQARKAKAKEAVAAELQRWVANPNDSICNHGQAKDIPDVCLQFIASFYHTYNSLIKTMSVHQAANGEAAMDALNVAYAKNVEAVENENLDILKKNFIGIGVSSLLEPSKYHPQMARGCAAALMLIDSYVPSSTVPLGMFDERDAKHYMKI